MFGTKSGLIFQFESNEDEKLLLTAETWQMDLQAKFPSREIKTTVVDINGKSVFLTRYFKALKPPEEIINNQESASSVQVNFPKHSRTLLEWPNKRESGQKMQVFLN